MRACFLPPLLSGLSLSLPLSLLRERRSGFPQRRRVFSFRDRGGRAEPSVSSDEKKGRKVDRFVRRSVNSTRDVRTTVGAVAVVTVGKLENVPTLPLRCECMSRVRVKFLREGTAAG